ncbi:MAG: LysR family transcriptional regulator [Ramlibacter sp.]
MTPEKKPATPADAAPASSGVGLSELETFIAVAELGSFSEAARRLHLSQPAVTARVQKLESLLGARLLHRTTRSVETTEDGQRLAAQAKQTLRDLRLLLSEFMQRRALDRHRVVVAASPMVAATLLPEVIGRFCARFTDVDVTVVDSRHALALEALERGEAELAFVALDEPQPRLRFTPLLTEPVVLVVQQGHALAGQESVGLRQLTPWPVMVLDKYSALQQALAQAYERQGLQFRPMATATNLTTLLGLLDAGRGVVLLPRCMAQHNALRPRVVVPLADCDLVRNYGIFSVRGRELSPAARSFLEFAQRDFAAADSSRIAG